MSAPLSRLLNVSARRLLLDHRLSLDADRDRRFFGRQGGLCGNRLADDFGGCEDGAQQSDLEQDGGEGVKGGGVAAFGALHRDPEAKRGLWDAVIEQDYACDDLQVVALNAFEGALDVMDEDDGVFKGVEFVGTDPGAEAEPSEDAGQAANIDRHPKVAPQQGSGVRTIGVQVGN